MFYYFMTLIFKTYSHSYSIMLCIFNWIVNVLQRCCFSRVSFCYVFLVYIILYGLILAWFVLKIKFFTLLISKTIKICLAEKLMTNNLYRDICGTKNLVIYKNGTAMHVSILIMLKHIKYQIGIEDLCCVPCMLFLLYFFFELQ